MLRSCLLLIISLLMMQSLHAQKEGLTKAEQKALDSMLRNDDFLNLLKERNRSYFDISVGMGNGVFSLKNNALNAGQSETNKIFFSPSVGYFHKTGLAIAFDCFIASDSGSLKAYQYAINPSYTYSGKSIEATISYTRYIKGSGTSFEISPFKNDIYASAYYKKTWVQPGLAAGFSTGKYTEYFDSSFWFNPPIGQPRVVHIRDTIDTRIQGFSLTAMASHEWDFEKLLTKKDALTIQPTLLLNAGSQHWSISHSNSLNKRRAVVQNLLKSRYGDGSASESFTLQSLAFLTEVTYYIGKFYLQPQIYLDYYLPSTTGKRLTALYSVVAGVNF